MPGGVVRAAGRRGGRGDRSENGSGKSTFLRVLAGLERDFAGACQINVPLRQRVFVHQTPYLFRGTVWSNVMYGLRAHRVPKRDAIARQWLARLAIEHLAQRGVDQLSGGERKRTALAGPSPWGRS